MTIFVFSTELHEITLKELETGKVKSTGGTCFNTWAQDLAESERDVKAAIIITDGYGDCDKEWLKKIEEQKKLIVILRIAIVFLNRRSEENILYWR